MMRQRLAFWLYGIAARLYPGLAAQIHSLVSYSSEVKYDRAYLYAIYDNDEKIQRMMEKEAAEKLLLGLKDLCVFDKVLTEDGNFSMRATVLAFKPNKTISE